MSTAAANALRAARARIDTPEKWQLMGRSLSVLLMVIREHRDEVTRALLNAGVITTTHADIMALFDRAIAAEEETP